MCAHGEPSRRKPLLYQFLRFDLAPDNRHVAFIRRGTSAHVWSLATGRLVTQLERNGFNNLPWCLRYTPDGTALMCGSSTGGDVWCWGDDVISRGKDISAESVGGSWTTGTLVRRPVNPPEAVGCRLYVVAVVAIVVVIAVVAVVVAVVVIVVVVCLLSVVCCLLSLSLSLSLSLTGCVC